MAGRSVTTNIFRAGAVQHLKNEQEGNHGVALSTIAINMWKRFLEKNNLTAENKSAEMIRAAAKEFREVFKENTYQSNEVVEVIKIMESADFQTPLEKQISMFPEAGQLFVRLFICL